MKKSILRLAFILLILLLVTVTGCSKAKDMMEEAEEQLESAQELIDETSLELEEASEKLEEVVNELSEEEATSDQEDEDKIVEEGKETTDEESDEVLDDTNLEETEDKEYNELSQARFTIGGMEVYVNNVESFIENKEMNLPYQEGKGYLYIEGTIANNLNEEMALNQVLFLAAYDESGKQIGNASSWIDSNGIYDKVEAGKEIEFNDLYMFNADKAYLTLEFLGKNDDKDAFFKVNVEDVSKESEEEASADKEEMLNILTMMSYDIIAAIDQDNFEEVAKYSEYSFIAPSLTSNVYDGLFFESYNWENCGTDEGVYSWGIDSSGNVIDMTCKDFFDSYISDYNFLANEPEIKQARLEYYPELSDYQATHYVKYRSGSQVCYLIYEETYFNEFILTGIGLGVE